MSRARALLGPVSVGLAVWCAAGTIAVADAVDPATRVAVPAPWWVLVAAIAASALVPVWRQRPSTAAPALVATWPWWPVPLPSAALIWTGPIAWLPISIALALASSGLWRGVVFGVTGASPRVAATLAGVAAFACSAATAWSIAPRVPGGDEPHYLVIAQSLWLDGDLAIRNNHDRRDYASYFGGTLAPDFIQRGKDGEVYSIHAPGTSALVLPAFLAFGYRGAQITVMIAAAAAAMLVWLIGWRLTHSAGAAWFGWAAVVGTPVFLVQSATVFPDGLALAASAAGLALLVRVSDAHPPGGGLVLGTSVALAALPWLHTRFVVIAAGLGAALVWRLKGRARLEFVLLPLAAALAWFGYFYAIYGTWNPAAPYGTDSSLTSARFIPGGLLGLLFDQQFGLLAYAPVLAAVPVGLWWARRDPAGRFATWASAAIAAAYLAAATTYWMWWVGVPAPPARLATVVLPLVVPALAVSFARATARGRATWLALLAVTAAVAAVTVAVDRGALAWNPRDAQARWLDWLSPVVNLPRAWPSFFWRLDPADLSTEWPFAVHVACWIGAPAALGALIARLARRQDWTIARWRAALAWWMVASAMTAASIGWRLNGVSGVESTRAQLGVLAATGEAGQVWRVARWSVGRTEVTSVLLRPRSVGRVQGNQPWFAAADVPAGSYDLEIETDRAASGNVALMIGRAGLPVRYWALAPETRQVVTVDLPAGAARLSIQPDPTAEQSGGRVRLRPRTLAGGTTRFAWHVTVLGSTRTYFLDQEAFPDSEGFWVRGGRTTELVVTADGRSSVDLIVRGGPAVTDALIQAGSARADVSLPPGDERRLTYPIEPDGTLRLTITSRNGFRPSEISASADTRWLGVWIEVR